MTLPMARSADAFQSDSNCACSSSGGVSSAVAAREGRPRGLFAAFLSALALFVYSPDLTYFRVVLTGSAGATRYTLAHPGCSVD